jgi:hypothetical protein
MKQFQKALKEVVVSSSSPSKMMKSSLHRKFSSHNNLIAASVSSPVKLTPGLSSGSPVIPSQSRKFSTLQKISIQNASPIPVFVGLQKCEQTSIFQDLQETSVKDLSTQSEEEYTSSEE